MPYINRFILKGVALLLSFSLGFSASLVLITYNPKIVSYANYYYKFFILQVFNKKLITQRVISGDKVYFYSERIDGKIVEISNFNEFEPMIKKAYEDFPIFVRKRYGITLPKIKNGFLIVTFVGGRTYDAYNDTRDKDPSGAFTSGNKIFLKSDDFKFNTTSRKGNIRHEIFHFLENKYSIVFLSHQDAFDFATWVKE